MSQVQEFRGKTVDAAIAEAERALGHNRDRLQITVISRGARGVFGIGGELARISVIGPSITNESEGETAPSSTIASTELEASNTLATATNMPSGQSKHQVRSVTQHKPNVPASPQSAAEFSDASIAEGAQRIVTQILHLLGFPQADVRVRNGVQPLTIDISGSDLGLLIGRRGENLMGLQFIVNSILAKQFRVWPRLLIDIEGYRNRREESLSSLGNRVADRVGRNRRSFTLEAMPANDRRIIHLTLRDRADIETYSVGDGSARRVVVAPKHAR